MMKGRVGALITIFFITPFFLTSPLIFNLQGNNIDRIIGQLIICGFRGSTLTPENPIYDDIREGRIGGVVLYDFDAQLKRADRNIVNPAQVKKLISDLQAISPEPLFVAVDEEGGYVNNLKGKKGFIDIPSAEKLAALNDPALTELAAFKIGTMLSAAGFNLNFAPVVDLNLNSNNPIIGYFERSFSANPETVTLHAEAFIRGLKRAGIISCIKHFPGHGSSQSDSHLGITDVTESWQTIELEPYKRMIANKSCQFIMTAHIYNARLDADYPATLSKKTVKKILRDELNFQGVIVSDDLQMKAISEHYSLKEIVRLSHNAGVDILLFSNNISYDPHLALKVNMVIKELLAEGEITIFQLFSSYNRVMRARRAYLT